MYSHRLTLLKLLIEGWNREGCICFFTQYNLDHSQVPHFV